MILPEINSGMQALILGYGVSGKAAERLLNSKGIETTVLNNEDEFPQGKNFDFAITSPGIPLNHKWHLECNLKGIPIASELSLAAKFWRGHIMAITGSKGKSSIVKLIADTLNNSGLVATACGNYGLPFCDVAFESHTTNDWAIVEVSSFQMETTEKEDFHPDFAAAVNLQEDHIDRHGSVDVYHECKLKLLESANIAFVSRGCKAVVKGGYLSASQMRGNVKETEEISESFINGTYFGNSILKMNAECAISLMKCVGLSDEEIISGLRNFKPLPHRMCVIGEWNGVKYIDDSKATSLAAMVAAIKMAENGKPIHLIAGGLAKGDDPNFITKDLSKSVKKVYLIGSCANQFFEAWKNDVPCKICETLDRAVDEVMRNVCTQETVLLSPGTASFDQFKSYGARGDMFASLVRARVIQSLRASPKEDEKI
jgi:UDP-N-acetylmuramoylalanine--D-glutamate ligase